MGDELPDVLKKLEILPCVRATKLISDNSSVTFNPFYSKELHKDHTSEITEIFGNDCNCFCRASSIQHRIIKNAAFKHKQSSKLLKEPILKSIRKCTHRRNVRHGKVKTFKDRFDELADCPNLDGLKLEDSDVCKTSNKSQSLDFHHLAEQFDLMNADRTKSDCDSLCSFTTIQCCDLRVKNSKKIRRPLSKMKRDTNLEQNSNGNSSSCAQQARIPAPSSCDVTIDELASYFETFVHIPKKMSTMAEMMYI